MTLNSPLFDEKVLRVARQLDVCGLPYALGGAIAYGYWGVPRGTRDIDINIFLPEASGAETLQCLAAIGVEPSSADALDRIRRDGQVRLRLGETYVDLFFAYSEFHERCRERSQRAWWAGTEVNVLSAEDIVIFKILFNRGQDWGDIERVVRVQGPRLDRAYIHDWIVSFVGEDDVRTRHLDELLAGATD